MRFFSIVMMILFFQNSFSQVGVNTATPMSTLDINGNLSVKVVLLTGSGAITPINDGVYISLNPQATDQEFMLPNPVTYPGRVYFLRNINNSNTAKLTTAGGNFFFKGLTSGGESVLYMYNDHYRTMLLVSDGSNWTVFENKL